MKKLLVVVDMQNDFIDGSLGSNEAKNAVSEVSRIIDDWDGDIAVTMDTHSKNYLETLEGQRLPVEHCIRLTEGWAINNEVFAALRSHKDYTYFRYFHKNTFGSLGLMDYVSEHKYDRVELVGVCTDICVVSNAMLIKAALPEAQVIIHEKACAGTTVENHNKALDVMRSCQIDVI